LDAFGVGQRFAMAFHARGEGIDLEIYHPLEAYGGKLECGRYPASVGFSRGRN
jgi:hypothetical protein